jgi:hypothetical protein
MATDYNFNTFRKWMFFSATLKPRSFCIFLSRFGHHTYSELRLRQSRSTHLIAMKINIRSLVIFFVICLSATGVYAESCSTSSEMDASVKTALQNAAIQYFGYIASANVAQVAANSITDIANNTEGVTGLLNEHKDKLAGATASVRNVYFLDASGQAPLERADFFCGVFNSSAKVGFTLQNLPPGKYGMVIMDVQNSKIPYFYSLLLLQQGTAWKIAGLFPRPRQIAGHDAMWFWQQARDFEAKGERHNAWYYYLAAKEVATPLPFMSTDKIDSFYQEIQGAMPPDLPEQKPLALQAANGKMYQVTNLFVIPSDKGQGLDLVVKYQTPDISDTGKTFLENKEVMKAVLAKYPEFKPVYGNLVARAVAPSGQDFGSMLPVKDLQ